MGVFDFFFRWSGIKAQDYFATSIMYWSLQTSQKEKKKVLLFIVRRQNALYIRENSLENILATG